MKILKINDVLYCAARAQGVFQQPVSVLYFPFSEATPIEKIRQWPGQRENLQTTIENLICDSPTIHNITYHNINIITYRTNLE